MLCERCFDRPAICNAGHCESCCSCGFSRTGMFDDDIGEYCYNCDSYKPELCGDCDECKDCCTCEVE